MIPTADLFDLIRGRRTVANAAHYAFVLLEPSHKARAYMRSGRRLRRNQRWAWHRFHRAEVWRGNSHANRRHFPAASKEHIMAMPCFMQQWRVM